MGIVQLTCLSEGIVLLNRIPHSFFVLKKFLFLKLMQHREKNERYVGNTNKWIF